MTLLKVIEEYEVINAGQFWDDKMTQDEKEFMTKKIQEKHPEFDPNNADHILFITDYTLSEDEHDVNFIRSVLKLRKPLYFVDYYDPTDNIKIMQYEIDEKLSICCNAKLVFEICQDCILENTVEGKDPKECSDFKFGVCTDCGIDQNPKNFY